MTTNTYACRNQFGRIFGYLLCIFFVPGLFLFVGPLYGKDINSGAGTSAFAFLKINSGARPVAMGGAFTGVADDENSLYYNPAGIASMDRNGVIFGYHNYFVDLQSGTVGYIHQRREKHYFAGSINYLNYGSFTQTDNLGNVTGEFGGGDLQFAFTFAVRHNERFSFGATGKLIYEKIQEFSATGVALDLGVRYTSNRGRMTAGAMLQNLGAQLSNFTDADKDGLPTTFRLGAAGRPRGLPILFAADVIVPTDNDMSIAIGGEYYEFKPLYLRIGWNSFGSNYRAADSDNNTAGISMGIGIDWRNKQLSYAFSPGAELGDSHRITLTGGI